MAFPFVHLAIAYNILCDTPQIKNSSDFMLGAIAPDSVHFRDDFDSSMKKVSHLVNGDEKWGYVTDNKKWQEDVLTFLNENRNTERADFIYGYCAHVITDIQSNIKIWIPFRTAFMGSLENIYGSTYHKEAFEVDQALYKFHPQKEVMWQMLRESISFDIPNVVIGKETDKLKDNILNAQYKDKEISDLSNYKFVTVNGMEEFIRVESKYIKNILYP